MSAVHEMILSAEETSADFGYGLVITMSPEVARQFADEIIKACRKNDSIAKDSLLQLAKKIRCEL